MRLQLRGFMFSSSICTYTHATQFYRGGQREGRVFGSGFENLPHHREGDIDRPSHLSPPRPHTSEGGTGETNYESAPRRKGGGGPPDGTGRERESGIGTKPDSGAKSFTPDMFPAIGFPRRMEFYAKSSLISKHFFFIKNFRERRTGLTGSAAPPSSGQMSSRSLANGRPRPGGVTTPTGPPGPS